MMRRVIAYLTNIKAWKTPGRTFIAYINSRIDEIEVDDGVVRIVGSRRNPYHTPRKAGARFSKKAVHPSL